MKKTDLVDFTDIQIQFITGDEVKVLYKMHIFKENDKVKALKQKPFYFYGSKTDSLWTSYIKQPEIQLIQKFISKAENQKDTCAFSSTSIDYYTIKIEGKKQINIIGNCNWDGIDYTSLERKIFAKKFAELENKRRVIADSIINNLIGSWKVTGIENGFINGTKVTLRRINDSKLENEKHKIWTFHKSFKNQMKKDLDIDEGNSLINIKGSMYKIINIEAQKIELEYLW